MLMLYFYLIGGLYIVWRGQLLYICDWGVWRHLGTDIFNSSHAFFILMPNLGIIGTTIIIMKKIIALSFLLCIPMFMVAQTFKVVDVKGNWSQREQDELLGSILVMTFYKNSIKIHPQENKNDVTVVKKSPDEENTYYAQLNNGKTEIKMTLTTILSYVRKAHITINEKRDSKSYGALCEKIEMELERE